MRTATRSVKLLVATYAAYFCLVLHSCRAQDEHNTIQDCASSCGNIHNIAYPFRLKTDPKHCGTKDYELTCEDNVVVLYLNVGETEQVEGYRVQAINYNNITIRLADSNVFKDNCTLLHMNSTPYWSYSYTLRYGYSGEYSFSYLYLHLISCAYPLSESLDKFNLPCNKVPENDSNSFFLKKRYWYFNIDDDISDLENSCRVESMSMIILPLGADNISYTDVINSFAYGNEISWESACCASEVSQKYNCSTVDPYCSTVDSYGYSNWLVAGRYYLLKILSFGNKYIARLIDMVADTILALFFLLAGKNIPKTYWGFDYFMSDTLRIDYFLTDTFWDFDNYISRTYRELEKTVQLMYLAVLILIGFVIYKVLLCLCGTPCVTMFLIYKWRRRHLSAYDNVEEFLQSH